MLTPTTPAERQLIRYRSDYVCRALYRVFNGMKSWQTMSTHDRYDGSTVENPKGSVPKGGKYLHIAIDAEASLGIEKHAVIIWQSDLKRAFKEMREDEADEWQAMLFRDIWQAIWYVQRREGCLKRAPATNEALAAACYKVAKLAQLDKRSI
jgi:hypothetical protein